MSILGIIKIIFEKAILEPKFSLMYAHLCQQLMKAQGQVGGEEGKEKEGQNQKCCEGSKAKG